MARYNASLAQTSSRVRFEKYIEPRLGDKRLHTISNADLEDLTLAVESAVGARTANMSRQLVLVLLKWALKRDRMPVNWRLPEAPLARENATRQDNYITKTNTKDFELAVLALRNRPSYRRGEADSAADLILLALYTGARRGNLQQMEWREIDFDTGLWHIPAAKYKTRAKVSAGTSITLIQRAVNILRKREGEKQSARWVFPSSRNASKPVDNVAKSWLWVREQAGLGHLTFHGLRHTIGTWQGHGGVNQKFIAASLGQRSLDSTERYVHTEHEQVRQNMTQAIEANMPEGPHLVSARLPEESWQKVLAALPPTLRNELQAAMD